MLKIHTLPSPHRLDVLFIYTKLDLLLWIIKQRDRIYVPEAR